MKIIRIPLLLIFLLQFSTLAKAQGNLQFNQVILAGNGVNIVPSGKVWKIESVLSNATLAPGLPASNTTGAATNSLKIKINGSDIYLSSWLENEYSSYRGHTAFGQITSLPIWLPAGTTLELSTNAVYISVVEFNIIP